MKCNNKKNLVIRENIFYMRYLKNYGKLSSIVFLLLLRSWLKKKKRIQTWVHAFFLTHDMIKWNSECTSADKTPKLVGSLIWC